MVTEMPLIKQLEKALADESQCHSAVYLTDRSYFSQKVSVANAWSPSTPQPEAGGSEV